MIEPESHEDNEYDAGRKGAATQCLQRSRAVALRCSAQCPVAGLPGCRVEGKVGWSVGRPLARGEDVEFRGPKIIRVGRGCEIVYVVCVCGGGRRGSRGEKEEVSR
jgi:hypothetical protein